MSENFNRRHPGALSPVDICPDIINHMLDFDVVQSVTVDPETCYVGYQLIVLNHLKLGATWREIKTALAGCHPEAQFRNSWTSFHRMLVATALGYPHYLVSSVVSNNGPPQYLCPQDILLLVALADRFDADGNPLTGAALRSHAHILKQKRIQVAIELLARSPKLAASVAELADTPPPDNFVSIFTDLTGMEFTAPRMLDHNRLYAANPTRLRNFYTAFRYIIDNAVVKLNADEMGVDPSRGRCKLVSRRRNPVAEQHPDVSHVSVMCTILSTGEAAPPYVIISDRVNFPPELECYKNQAWFASSSKGWMTEVLFYGWCVLLVHWLAEYRRTHNYLQQWFVLLLDGHGSRACPEAIELLMNHRVLMLIFPSHTTHVVQPYDVCVASPMRGHFGPCRTKLTRQTPRANFDSEAAYNRYIITGAVIAAFQMAANRLNVLSAFEKTGISPFNIDRVLQSPFVIDGPFVEPAANELALGGKILHDQNVLRGITARKIGNGRARRYYWPRPSGGIFVADPFPNFGLAVQWLTVSNRTRSHSPNRNFKQEADGVVFTKPAPISKMTPIGWVQPYQLYQ